MEIPDELLCVFSAQVEERDGAYRLTVPEREVDNGAVDADGTYRIALLGSDSSTASSESDQSEAYRQPPPPVEVGDRRSVEIEGIGEQGDGIARVERGYVIIVPDAEKHEKVTIEITKVNENVAFSEVVEREPYYE